MKELPKIKREVKYDYIATNVEVSQRQESITRDKFTNEKINVTRQDQQNFVAYNEDKHVTNYEYAQNIQIFGEEAKKFLTWITRNPVIQKHFVIYDGEGNDIGIAINTKSRTHLHDTEPWRYIANVAFSRYEVDQGYTLKTKLVKPLAEIEYVENDEDRKLLDIELNQYLTTF